MVTRILVSIALLIGCISAFADEITPIPAYAVSTSPFFGSATQEPVQIAIDLNTGLPLVAAADEPQPIVAARE